MAGFNEIYGKLNETSEGLERENDERILNYQQNQKRKLSLDEQSARVARIVNNIDLEGLDSIDVVSVQKEEKVEDISKTNEQAIEEAHTRASGISEKIDAIFNDNLDQQQKNEVVESSENKQTDLHPRVNVDIFYDIQEFNSKVEELEWFQIEEHKYLAKYQMKDGSIYETIADDTDELLERVQNVLKNPQITSLEPNKNSICNMMEGVLKNIQTYYSYKEMVRFGEHLDGKMDPELRMIVGDLEQVVKSQVDFCRKVSPMLWQGKSPYFPNVVYNDATPRNFYPSEKYQYLINDEQDFIVHSRYAVVDKLCSMKDYSFTSDEILSTIYSSKYLKDARLKSENEIKDTMEENGYGGK